MLNEQFVSRNIQELADVIIDFRELNDVCDSNLYLTLEQDYWEIFDGRACKSIFRYPFKHICALKESMHQLKRDFINVGVVAATSKPIDKTEFASIRRLYNMYGMCDFIFSTNYLKNYVYGKF
jgi:hypothetical protein